MSFGDPQATVVFWRSPQVMMALQGGANAVVVGYHAVKMGDWGLVASCVGILVSMAYWLYRRIADGKNPANPAPTVTLTQKP